MTNTNKPAWIDTEKLVSAASDELQAKKKITFNLPADFKTISSYECNRCRLPFTSGQIEPQLRKAARAGQSYIECPKCSGVLKEKGSVIVRDAGSLIDRKTRAQKLINKDEPQQRGINTWIDKAIYGHLVNALSAYIEGLGITNPQLRFQRGIRTAKFPGEPHSAKGAEFTVEFVDFNNTRNRIVIQAGLDERGKFIYPRTFKTLSGNEYPLTSLAIEDFTSGKKYTPVTVDHSIPPLHYKPRNPVEFREISANVRRIIKNAAGEMPSGTPQNMGALPDPNAQMYRAEDIAKAMGGFTPESDPLKFEQLQQALKNNQFGDWFAQQTQNQQDPNAQQNLQQGLQGTMNSGIALSALKGIAFQDLMNNPPQYTDDVTNMKQRSVAEAIEQGLTFSEAYDKVRLDTGLPLSIEEFDAIGQTLIGGQQMPGEQQMSGGQQMPIAAMAAKLIAKAELTAVAKLHITAEDVKDTYDTSNMTFTEAQKWMDEYVDTFNTQLDKGAGPVEAKIQANAAAVDLISSLRIKKALRDKSTLVPFTDPKPDYSLAQQTKDSEAKFDMPYDETDGGIPKLEDRPVSKMFRGKTPPTSEAKTLSMIREAVVVEEGGKYVVKSEDRSKTLGTHDSKEDAEKQLQAIEINKHKKGAIEKIAEPTGIDLDTKEVGQNPINYSRYKTMVQDYLRAGNIPPTKVDLHALKDNKYTLDELKKLIDTVKTKDDSAFYPTAHADIDVEKIRKMALDSLGDIMKDLPMERVDNPAPVTEQPVTEQPVTEQPVGTLEGGKADNASPAEFDPNELDMGIQVETEHTNDPGLAREIAMDHLSEIPNYYTLLKKMEADAAIRQSTNPIRDTVALTDRLISIARQQVLSKK